MKNLMYETTCSDIRMAELKLKRIRIWQEHLLKNKPSPFNNKKNKIWQEKFNILKKEEEDTTTFLQITYDKLAKFL